MIASRSALYAWRLAGPPALLCNRSMRMSRSRSMPTSVTSAYLHTSAGERKSADSLCVTQAAAAAAAWRVIARLPQLARSAYSISFAK